MFLIHVTSYERKIGSIDGIKSILMFRILIFKHYFSFHFVEMGADWLHDGLFVYRACFIPVDLSVLRKRL